MLNAARGWSIYPGIQIGYAGAQEQIRNQCLDDAETGLFSRRWSASEPAALPWVRWDRTHHTAETPPTAPAAIDAKSLLLAYLNEIKSQPKG